MRAARHPLDQGIIKRHVALQLVCNEEALAAQRLIADVVGVAVLLERAPTHKVAAEDAIKQLEERGGLSS